MIKVKLAQDIQTNGLKLLAGSELMVAPVVAKDWAVRGYVEPEKKRVKTKRSKPVDGGTGDGDDDSAGGDS